MTLDKTNDPALESWIRVEKESDFPIQNLPFGIYRRNGESPVAASRIGDTVIDLCALATFQFLDGLDIDTDVFSRPFLNDFISLGKPSWRKVRERLSFIFERSNDLLRDNEGLKEQVLFPLRSVEMMMPVLVGDYTDFYSSIDHATNVGKMFRDPANALLPNWRHMPVGYHGRSSSIVVSGTPVHRPKGQYIEGKASLPSFGPTHELDFELEMAFIAGKQTDLGDSVSTGDAEDHIFGLVLFNDLSARDIQRWEYVPLGPFQAKNFGSVISPWIVTLDALEPFRVKGPVQEPPVLPYLQFEGDHHFDIGLEVALKPPDSDECTVTKTNYRYLYWNIAQQLAHQTINGCNINPGDMYASGTISGPEKGTFGSMLEITWNGTDPIRMPGGLTRKFIEDNDTIIFRGYSRKNGLRIGFGETTTKILPAITMK